MTHYLTSKQIILLNALVIKRYTPTEGIRVKDPHLLESAVNRPKQSAFGEDAYPTIWLKAACLFESLAKNHAFVGGNKRTSLSALHQFLWINGLMFQANQEEVEDFTIEIITMKEPPIPLLKIANWIESNAIRRSS